VLGGNALAVVGDADSQSPAGGVASDADTDAAAVVAGVDGVGQEVQQGAVEVAGVEGHVVQAVGGGALDRNVPFGGPFGHQLADLLGQIVDIGGEGVGFGVAGQGEHVQHQRGEHVVVATHPLPALADPLDVRGRQGLLD